MFPSELNGPRNKKKKSIPIKPTKRIAFVHPDLGIGGAERLVVDAALGLQRLGHHVEFFVHHHSDNHCFQETHSQHGSLRVTSIGEWIPRTILGRFHALLSMINSIYLAIVLFFTIKFSRSRKSHNNQNRILQRYDVIIVDSIPWSIPILALSCKKIIYYAHFPDLLLCTSRDSIFKKIYRYPIDNLEKITVHFANLILCNSKFTKSVCMAVFGVKDSSCRVLYPPIDVEYYENLLQSASMESEQAIASNSSDIESTVLKSDFEEQNSIPLPDDFIWRTSTIFLSINRYEPKKNISVAIEALIATKNPRYLLVISGGYDPRVSENVSYDEELYELALESNLNIVYHPLFLPHHVPGSPSVIFMHNFTMTQRTKLFQLAHAVIYTPSLEHFGIVPLEAMVSGVPVIAADSAGPVETVVPGTGYLVHDDSMFDPGTFEMEYIPTDPQDWAEKMHIIAHLRTKSPEMYSHICDSAKKHVVQNFSLKDFAVRLENFL